MLSMCCVIYGVVVVWTACARELKKSTVHPYLFLCTHFSTVGCGPQSIFLKPTVAHWVWLRLTPRKTGDSLREMGLLESWEGWELGGR
jgi:hypothetical protein